MTTSERRGRSGLNDPNSRISSKLREFYDSVQEQEIPDKFLDLLEKLDAAEQAAKGTKNDQSD